AVERADCDVHAHQALIEQVAGDPGDGDVLARRGWLLPACAGVQRVERDGSLLEYARGAQPHELVTRRIVKRAPRSARTAAVAGLEILRHDLCARPVV